MKYNLRTKLIILCMAAALAVSLAVLSSCSESITEEDDLSSHLTGSMDLAYADQFHVDYYEDGVSIVSIEDGLEYLIIEDNTSDDIPSWFPESRLNEMTVIHAPAERVYLAASSGMDLADAAGGLDQIVMTSTEGHDWGIDKIRKLVEDGTIRYIGKYRAPDYEALVEEDVDLAIESTMIYHNPEVKEQLESLGIPVLVERSSYESDPMGRLEWIKLYGLLLGRAEEAEAYFNDAVSKISSINTDNEDPPSVAFFSVNSSGSVVVRKPGDYVTHMIRMAGGTYALDDVLVDEENALSTMNMQMEAFYENALDADIIIYNSTIEGAIESIDDLTAMSDGFSDFRAVKEGHVWCTYSNVFQKTTGAADMIEEMSRIFSGADNDTGMEYFHLLGHK